MVAFFAILKNDMNLIFRDWKAILLIMTLPVLMLVMFAVALAPMLKGTSFIDPFPIALVDREKSIWSDLLAKQLTNFALISKVLYVSEEEAIRLVENGEAAAAIVLPEGLGESVSVWKPKSVIIYGSSLQPLQSEVVLHTGLIGARMVTSGIATLDALYRYDAAIGLTEGELLDEMNAVNSEYILKVLGRRDMFREWFAKKLKVTAIEYYGAALMAVFILFASMPCMKLMANDRQSGVLGRLHSSCTSGVPVLLSRLAVTLMVTGLQFGVIYAVTSYLFHSYWKSSPLAVPLLFITTVFASASYSLFVAALAKTPAATDIFGYLGVLLMAVLGGNIYPIASMPDWVRFISGGMLTRWSRVGFMSVFAGTGEDVFTAAAMLSLIAVFFLAFALIVMKIRRRSA
jgi:ABC-2 type transport system permease protein